jgi:type I restriction enzyme, S subunit
VSASNNVLLGDIAEIVMGQAPPGTDCNRDGRGKVFVKAGEFDDRRPVVREWTTNPLRVARIGDVLVCVVGATAGKVNESIDCAIGRSVAGVRPNPKILLSSYLYHFLAGQVLRLRAKSQGLAQGVITREMLREILVPFPPLPEQRRIAEVLDRAEALRSQRRATLAQLDSLTQSIFLDLFGAPATNPKGWPLVEFGKLVENQDSRRVPVKSSDRDGRKGHYPYYGASGIIDWVDDYLFDGDRLLIGEDGANLVARSTPVAYIARGKYWVNNHAHVLAENGRANLRFLEFFVEQSDLKPFISGTAQPKLNRSNLDRIPVPLPPMALQQEFAGRTAAVEKLATAHRASLAELDTLFAVLQFRAFRGEL